MLDDRIVSFLTEKSGEVLPEYQERFKKALKDFGVNENSDFFIFMSKYSDEFYGKEGLMYDVANDLLDDNNVTTHLHEKAGVPKNFISLFNLEVDDYLLYNTLDDSVILINGGNIQKVKENVSDKKWNSFNEFLLDFFEIE